MKTEALWYLGERKLELRPTMLPEPEAHEVLVEMELCGVCGWDLLAYAGRFGKFHPYPFRAGHEGIGRVLKAGPLARGIEVGQRVACQELPIGSREGGLMARHALRAFDKVAPIPEGSGVPLREWLVEPVACALNGLLYAEPRPGAAVALVGAGYMGLLLLQALRLSPAARVAVFEPEPSRLELARRLAGASPGFEFHSPEGASPGPGLASSFELVIESAGSPGALELAFALAAPYAVIENFAWHHHRQDFDLDDWHTRGWRILNVQPQMNPAFGQLFPRAVSLMAAGAISNAGLVSHAAPLERAEEVFAAGLERRGGYLKGVVEMAR